MPARAIDSRTTSAPSDVGGTSFNAPPKVPIAVRAAETITISFCTTVPLSIDCWVKMLRSAASHVRIVRPTTAFGRDPHDVLRRILDVARLAVHAVLRVDQE